MTSVKIEGVAHEFTTLAGRSRGRHRHPPQPQAARLHPPRRLPRGRGSADARAAKAPSRPPTSRCPADLEILNPELEIANVSSKGRLEITLTIGRGRGYMPAEGNRGHAHTIGVIPVDSMFSPVRRVAYDVEAARVGQRTDYDKLILDVTTNGSMDPKDAIAQARRDPDPPARDLHRPRRRSRASASTRRRSTAARWSTCRSRTGWRTSRSKSSSSACARTTASSGSASRRSATSSPRRENELASIPNFGKKSIEEVKETLAQHGLRLRGDNGSPSEA